MNSDDQQFSTQNSSNEGVLSTVKNLLWKIPRKLRIVASIVGITTLIIIALNAFKPEAQKRAVPETVVRVDVIEAQRSDYPIVVAANGTVEAETRGNLVAQIRGEIVSMADNFKTGGSFKAGDVLIEIDPRDYQAELSSAAAALSQAEASYRQEQANAKQAREDWERLGNTEPAPDLVLRKPQLAAARAALDSARAAHDTAKLNLSRTKITAPYDGRIISRAAVLGQYVAVGTPIAEVFSTTGVEVRLPISQDEYTQLGLEAFDPNDQTQQFQVVLSSTIGGEQYHWDAQISRTDSTFDLNTRQIDIIAKVINPFSAESGRPALKIGQFVNAQIQGRTVENVIVVPNKSIREGSYTYIVEDERLKKQAIDYLWQDDENTLIRSGLDVGTLVVTTSLNSTLAGAKARLPENFASNNSGASADNVEQSSESTADQPAMSTENTEGEPNAADDTATAPEGASGDGANNAIN